MKNKKSTIIKKQIQITVIGGNFADNAVTDDAERIGGIIAQNNCVLITGGRGGVMEAASRGAQKNDGIVVGILPSDKFSDANQYCSIVIPTDLGAGRNLINVLSADLIVCLDGQAGTLSELALAWQYDRKTLICTWTGGVSQKIYSFVPIQYKKLIYPVDSFSNFDQTFTELISLLN